MKKTIIFIFFFYSIFINAVLIEKEDNQEKEKYIVAVEGKQPPLQFIEDGEIKGFNIDLLNLIGEKCNIDFKFIQMDKNKSLEKLKKREVDLILGIRFEKELENRYRHTESIGDYTVCIVAPKNKIKKLKEGFGNSNFLVGVEKDSSEYNYLKTMKKINFNIVFDQKSLYELLKLNRADFIIGVKEIAEYMLLTDEFKSKYEIVNSYTAPVSYYIGVSYINEKLLKVLNEEIKNLKINGEYEKLFLKWNKEAELEREKEMLKKLKTISIVVIFLVFILLIISFLNFQLKKVVKEKTSELRKSNEELEKKIIEIRNNNELNSIICESSPRCITILDRYKRITFMNKNAINLFCPNGDFKGKTFYNYPIMEKILGNGIFEETIFKNKAHITREIKVSNKEKEEYYRYTLYPLLDYQKNNIGVFLTMEEFTEEKRYKDKIMRKEKDAAITTIIAGIAHEIRNPMTAIKTYIELLPLKKDNEKFREQLVTIVPKEVERVNKLIENLIDYVRPKQNLINIINIYEIINSSIILLKPTLNKNKIKLELNVLDKLTTKGDAGQIKQVIINLLLNAIDAIKEKREKLKLEEELKIKISGYIAENYVIIEILDEGIGMTKEELVNIFEVFYTTKSKGTGLGLSLSKQLIEKNNGQLYVESKKEKYSKFTIVFEVMN
ncbi:MAG: transporter substrate-binding domain-containing protein [Fusobacterium perfoetens]|uniref:ATP-binding protein n=1 Tax=Fusobacterium perfoetens TaxID=852 RepID=UPI0023F50538|nr:transporter substrate-binding domain-containing protein [Fusobacterium perfoetens]MCI6152517.1 transporter substrate-binding domain-containing protein [Fusobacterium perfoetens]MDY3237525.1 transporter substrate-binding domain-containing protein [Fusobacterium perfoetens]